MRFAQVIVDVSAYPVDRPFDYLIPEDWEELIDIGSRVKVPFGPRNVLGFVVGITAESDVPAEKIKPISEILDLESILTEEMLSLAKWLKHQTICYEIDALQVMLPGALRAKYEKYAVLQGEVSQLPQMLQPFFEKTEKVNLAQFEKANLLRPVKRAVKDGLLIIENVVKQKGQVKQVRKVQIYSREQIEDIIEQMGKRAPKQRAILEWMKEHAGAVVLPEQIYEAVQVTSSVLNSVIEKGAAAYIQEEVYRDPFTKEVVRTDFLQLTDEQDVALKKITEAIDDKRQETFLLHGITGSGKTEVYLQAIQRTIADGKEAIVLVPEISLTPQMTERFKSRFGNEVAVMHSGLSVGEKYDEWRKVQQGKVKVVVGARSAIFAPFKNLGLLILDEEHESTYKQEDSPRYHARDVAIWRGNYYNCPVILGSATPALESFARAKKGVYTLLTLSQRAKNQALPSVQIIDMREQLQAGNRSMFSEPLMEALRDRLEKKSRPSCF